MDGSGGWIDGWTDCGVRTSEATRTVAHHDAVPLLESEGGFSNSDIGECICLDGSTNEPNICNLDEILYLR